MCPILFTKYDISFLIQICTGTKNDAASDYCKNLILNGHLSQTVYHTRGVRKSNTGKCDLSQSGYLAQWVRKSNTGKCDLSQSEYLVQLVRKSNAGKRDVRQMYSHWIKIIKQVSLLSISENLTMLRTIYHWHEHLKVFFCLLIILLLARNSSFTL